MLCVCNNSRQLHIDYTNYAKFSEKCFAQDNRFLHTTTGDSHEESELRLGYTDFAGIAAKVAEKFLGDSTCAFQGYAAETSTSIKTYPHVGEIDATVYPHGFGIEADTCFIIATTGDSISGSGIRIEV